LNNSYIREFWHYQFDPTCATVRLDEYQSIQPGGNTGRRIEFDPQRHTSPFINIQQGVPMNKKLVYIFISVIIMVSLASCSPTTPEAPDLVLEQHLLTGSPQSEPMQFTPMEGSMEDILQTHAGERDNYLIDQISFVEGKIAIAGTLDGKPLMAEQFYENSGKDGFVTVTLDGNEIYRIDTGPGSPVNSLAGLWVVDGSWWLETVLVNLESEPFTTGQISRDGAFLNTSMNYQEAFGLQTIGGNPFHFFVRDSKIGYWYGDKETMLGYDEIPHYLCCSDSVLNPRASENMVSFFARTGDDWYYVELGLFSQ